MRRGKTSSSPTSLDGSLKPLQRFSCRDCGSTFTFERKVARPRAGFSDAVVMEAVRLYVQGLSSYRVLASMLEQRLNSSPSFVTVTRTFPDRPGREHLSTGRTPQSSSEARAAASGW